MRHRMGELDGLKIYGETQVGWCAATPPNETTDEHGAHFVPERDSRSVDPRAPARRVYDDPDVQRLREHLRKNIGMKGVEILEPHEVERAQRIFYRDGFVVVKNLLDPERLALWREASARVLKQILEIQGEGGRKYITETGRLPHRYSYGTASADRKSTRLNSSHSSISYAVFCLKKKNKPNNLINMPLTGKTGAFDNRCN